MSFENVGTESVPVAMAAAPVSTPAMAKRQSEKPVD